MYREITHGLQIDVEASFVPENSNPENHSFFFAYKIRITNHSETPAQLLRRNWLITDGNGVTHEVHGDGVVGQQPRLEPGQEFEYTSFCPLPTPTGNMRGSYEFRRDDGSEFHARIPLFFLRDLRNFQ